MINKLRLSVTHEHAASMPNQQSAWAKKFPLRNSILCQDGIIAAIFTTFAVLCAIPSFFIIIRPLYHFGVCANSVLLRIQLRSYIRRYPKISVVGCQITALILSSEWWPPNLWVGSPAGVSTTMLLWIFDLGILLVALPKLSSYPLTLEGIRLRIERTWPERWFAQRMRNPLDAYFVREVSFSTFIMVPAWVIVYKYGTLYPMNWIFFVISFSQNGLRHEVIDHTNMHNRLFRSNKDATWSTRIVFRVINIYMSYILNPLNLRVPFFYNIHHLCIHHRENNGVEDVQSTILYDRASFFDFCKYSLFFALDYTAGFMTLSYLIKQKKYRQIRIAVGGFIFWYAVVVSLWFFDPFATMFLLCYRFVTLFGSSFGAFAWHGFADADDPENITRNTINVVPSIDAHGYFGNFSHIVHHLRPGLHWSKVAQAALGQSGEFTKCGALQWDLNGGMFGGERIMKAIWLGRFDALLPFFAAWNNSGSDADALKIMRERTRSIFPVARSALYARLDRNFGVFAAKYLLVDKLPLSKSIP